MSTDCLIPFLLCNEYMCLESTHQTVHGSYLGEVDLGNGYSFYFMYLTFLSHSLLSMNFFIN